MSRPSSGSPVAELPDALLGPGAWPERVAPDELVETHISWVFLVGRSAYKVKKPVRLDFLDFSTLAGRRHYCEEELRINRRFAPELYREVVPIARTPAGLVAGGPGEPVEYAVRMRRFERRDELDRLLDDGRATPALLARFGTDLARLQAELPCAAVGHARARPDSTLAACRDNFDTLERLGPADIAARVDALRRWTEDQHARLAPRIAARLADGRFRECHGDLHCANVVLHGDRLWAFDALEFDPALRWIDVACDVAFLTMDLAARGHPELRAAALDGWLAESGDFGALAVFRFYEAYRAGVRAKVEAIRAAQRGPDGRPQPALGRYLAAAEAAARPPAPLLVVTTGLSGSGKSWLASRLLAPLDAVRIRSDVERKRLHGLASTESSAGRIYDAHSTRRTYERLGSLARLALESGFSVIVDAASLLASERRALLDVGHDLGVPARLLATEAGHQTLLDRVAARSASGRDPSEADRSVLERQLGFAEALDSGEREVAVVVDTGGQVDVAAVARRLRAPVTGAGGRQERS